MDSRVATRYAQALMDMGEEKSALEKISEDMISIETTVHGSRELRAVLHSPVVKPEQKLAILTEIFAKQLHPEVMDFVRLLVEKGRSELLLPIAEAFRSMLDTRRNILHASIVSAVELSEDERMSIQAKLENISGKRIRPAFSIDPSLKGGFTARIGDTLVDASLRHQLDLLREEFRHGGSAILN